MKGLFEAHLAVEGSRKVEAYELTTNGGKCG